MLDLAKREDVITCCRFLELCVRFDHSFSEVGFFLPTVSYGAPAGKIFLALRAIYLVELLVEPELEEFGRRVELVGRPDQKRQCGNLGLVFGTLCKI